MGLSLQTIQSDEFYTRYQDIEAEVSLYKEQFKDKSVYCNCDDYCASNFVKFFTDHFDDYQLKSLTATCLKPQGEYSGVKYFYDGTTEVITPLIKSGDALEGVCVGLVRQNDIVVTNPPFSIGKDFFKMLLYEQVDFLCIANINIASSGGVFPAVKDGILKFGKTHPKYFIAGNNVPDEAIKTIDGQRVVSFGNTCWFTTFDTGAPPLLELTKHYSAAEYPKYDNFDAIEVGRITDIPCDYYGAMGVPVTYLQKHNTQQFDIIWLAGSPGFPEDALEKLRHEPGTSLDAVLDGKRKFNRVFIQRKKRDK